MSRKQHTVAEPMPGFACRVFRYECIFKALKESGCTLVEFQQRPLAADGAEMRFTVEGEQEQIYTFDEVFNSHNGYKPDLQRKQKLQPSTYPSSFMDMLSA